MTTDHGELGNYNGDEMSAKFWASGREKTYVYLFFSEGGGKDHVLDDLKEIERGLM
jgi:hypothetical protein